MFTGNRLLVGYCGTQTIQKPIFEAWCMWILVQSILFYESIYYCNLYLLTKPKKWRDISHISKSSNILICVTGVEFSLSYWRLIFGASLLHQPSFCIYNINVLYITPSSNCMIFSPHEGWIWLYLYFETGKRL